ncbi:hypothetical protein MYSTI_06461 [Myxococcus stipitatus DSM 14675]|uniref:Uncharacterized protein n=1 Tax=Myxococcus stipitatus (strain DSM 14675 / JCM 12634 / Mx s8) TaxID=1278073 RepID=L7UMN5_MYXSD|nr:hypothetical protein [Myxococcus stipitatus]AGC47734.1 hypothetical protein MYSTI_06461 [Myxococcus stipitatus DSM 14675]
MATSKRLGAWRYRLGLGGSCEACGVRLRRAPAFRDGQRVCPRCALLGTPRALSDSVVHLGVEVGASILGDLFKAMFLWALVLVGLIGGLLGLLYLGVKHLSLPMGLAITVLAAAHGLTRFIFA